ncbi:MAG: hypothetical protein QGH72_06275 [Dehalococcoidia bacterium]|nr:hypothetical protein [Dehalococcoidia bacterium]
MLLGQWCCAPLWVGAVGVLPPLGVLREVALRLRQTRCQRGHMLREGVVREVRGMSDF